MINRVSFSSDSEVSQSNLSDNLNESNESETEESNNSVHVCADLIEEAELSTNILIEPIETDMTTQQQKNQCQTIRGANMATVEEEENELFGSVQSHEEEETQDLTLNEVLQNYGKLMTTLDSLDSTSSNRVRIFKSIFM